MSFPLAVAKLSEGMPANAALLFAMKHDTQLGFAAITGIVHALHASEGCPCCIVKNAVGLQHRKHVLRHEKRGAGVKIDFHPDSQVGKEVARLMTDAARPLLVEHTGLYFGFANCCGVIASPKMEDVRFTAEDQIRWQLSIDC